MKELILSKDEFKMNWIKAGTEWGTVKCAVPLDVETKSERDGDIIKEEYVFTNNTDKDIFTRLTDIGIYTPFNDEYTNAAECMKLKCHTHIWCGGRVAYVMALRMGGDAPHLGLVLTSGSIGGYRVERDLEKMSNDRGTFLLHPVPFSLAPGESCKISWTLFPHNGRDDFYDKAKKHCKTFLDVRADKYILFRGEVSEAKIIAGFDVEGKDVRIMQDDTSIPFTVSGRLIRFTAKATETGELLYLISVGGIRTHLRLLVMPPFDELIKTRCRFITEKQQYNRENSGLDGAYLIYDNEENKLFYSTENDFNGGRERVCMGILIASYLQKEYDGYIERSLLKYIDYVERELVNEETGEVYNDYGRDNSYKRLYNAPWFALFYVELYKLYKDKSRLSAAYKILMKYYEDGGDRFYPIELPAVQMIECLRSADMNGEADDLMVCFVRHADNIAAIGTNYPASEVNYEQSIVAPAADILLKVYSLSGKDKYLAAAKKQIDVLELFNGLQPDYHLYEVAIRHWDGYWFGKRRMYGDTFPHYWSALTGNVYYAYAMLTNSEEYFKKAEASLRGILSMFMPDGSASCAYVYPASVNGEKTGYYDPYANDQDWGLYFNLKKRQTYIERGLFI